MEYGALLYLASLILFNLFVKIRFVPEKLAFTFVAFAISLFLSLLPSQIHDVGNIWFCQEFHRNPCHPLELNAERINLIVDFLLLSLVECLKSSQGAGYRGTASKTKSGLTCQRWDSQSPHRHSTNTPQKNPTAGLEQNFCRNPDNEAKPWCYTTSSSKRWEVCNIKLCAEGKI